jgi:hypothetical protein
MPQDTEAVDAGERQLGDEQPRRTDLVHVLDSFLTVANQHDRGAELERQTAYSRGTAGVHNRDEHIVRAGRGVGSSTRCGHFAEVHL